MPLTEEQKQMCAAVGIDWQNIDWAKLAGFGIQILQLLQQFLAKGPVMMGAEHCDAEGKFCPEDCCANAICCQAEALRLMLEHHTHCCQK